MKVIKMEKENECEICNHVGAYPIQIVAGHYTYLCEGCHYAINEQLKNAFNISNDDKLDYIDACKEQSEVLNFGDYWHEEEEEEENEFDELEESKLEFRNIEDLKDILYEGIYSPAFGMMDGSHLYQIKGVGDDERLTCCGDGQNWHDKDDQTSQTVEGLWEKYLDEQICFFAESSQADEYRKTH